MTTVPLIGNLADRVASDRMNLGGTTASLRMNTPSGAYGLGKSTSAIGRTPTLGTTMSSPHGSAFPQPPPAAALAPATARPWRGVVSLKAKAAEEAALKAKTPRAVEYRSVAGKYPTPVDESEEFLKKKEQKERASLLCLAPPTPYEYFFPSIKGAVIPPSQGGPMAGFDPQPPTPRQPRYVPGEDEPAVSPNLNKVAYELGKKASDDGLLDYEGWRSALEVLSDPSHLEKVANDSWKLFDGDREGVVAVSSVLAMVDSLFTGPNGPVLVGVLFKHFSDPNHEEVILKAHLDDLRLARTEVNNNTRFMIVSLLRCIHANPRFVCDKREFLSLAEFTQMITCQADKVAIAAWEAQQGGKKKKTKKKSKGPILPEPPSAALVQRLGGELVAAFLPKIFAAMQKLFEGGALA